MKKKIFVFMAIMALTVPAFAAAYAYTIECGDGSVHRGYIGGVKDKMEALSVVADIAEALC